MSPGTAPDTPLGIPGFSFADLHQPARLRELYRQWVDDVKATEPELWAQWDQHRQSPGTLGPVARGDLIVAMAPHVSRFITRLFGVGDEAESLVQATRVNFLDQMPLADATYRRVATHRAERFDVMRYQQCRCAHARGPDPHWV